MASVLVPVATLVRLCSCIDALEKLSDRAQGISEVSHSRHTNKRPRVESPDSGDDTLVGSLNRALGVSEVLHNPHINKRNRVDGPDAGESSRSGEVERPAANVNTLDVQEQLAQRERIFDELVHGRYRMSDADSDSSTPAQVERVVTQVRIYRTSSQVPIPSDLVCNTETLR